MSSYDVGYSKHFSNLISGVTAGLTALVGILYSCALLLMYRSSQLHPRKFKSKSGMHLQRYAPVFYAFLVFSSISEIAVVSWLLLQYSHNRNAPSTTARTGLRLLLFSACWTVATAGMYTVFFLHSNLYKHPIASIGAQSIWLLITWVIWVSGASILNSAIPSLFVGGSCITVVYCEQLQTAFAFSVLEIFTMTVGMLTAIALAWQSTHDVFRSKTAR